MENLKNLVNSIDKHGNSQENTWRPVLGGKKGIPEALKLEIMKTVHDPVYFIEKLIPHLQKIIPDSELVNSNSKSNNQITILIASPQSIAQYFDQIDKNLTINGKKIKIITSIDTLNFMKDMEKELNCKLLADYLGDILSYAATGDRLHRLYRRLFGILS